MKPLQIRFCYAISHGDTARASALLPKINIAEQDDYGLNVISFVLASTQMSPYDSVLLLRTLYPNPKVKDPCPTGHLASICLKEAFKATLRSFIRHKDVISSATAVAHAVFHEHKELTQHIAKLALTYLQTHNNTIALNEKLNERMADLVRNLQSILSTAPIKKCDAKILSQITSSAHEPLQKMRLKTLTATLNGTGPSCKGVDVLEAEKQSCLFLFNKLRLSQPLLEPDSWQGFSPKLGA